MVVGGGKVAERKISGLLEAQAQVRVISPRLSSKLSQLVISRQLDWYERTYQPGDLKGAVLAIAATDSRETQQQIVAEAEQAGLLVNVIDDPEKCSFQVPAVVRRGALTLAVSTGGRSPAVAAMVRENLEKQIGPEYGILLDLLAEVRKKVIAEPLDCGSRKIKFKKILHKDILSWIKNEQWDLLRSHVEQVLGYELDYVKSMPGKQKQ